MQAIKATVSSYVYTRLIARFRNRTQSIQATANIATNATRILAICDPMTWHNLSSETYATALTPTNWRKTFATAKPENSILFCEAAWTGIGNQPWRGQIYQDKRVRYNNRKYLLAILRHCKQHNIPTVFWAKEDPAYFKHPIYDFTDTALRFDYILSTCAESVSQYKALGHTNAHLWRFSFSPRDYYPPKPETPRHNQAVFAGSWFTDHPKRCEELTTIFDQVLAQGIELVIYDRNQTNARSTKPFPIKYQSYVQNAVPYGNLGDIYRQSNFVININTVTDSPTMYARRVFEAMACGAIVITNPAKGLVAEFGDNLWHMGHDFDQSNIETIRQHNIGTVFARHTWQTRLTELESILCKQLVSSD